MSDSGLSTAEAAKSSEGFPAPPPPPDQAIVTQWTQWFGQIRALAILLGGMGLGGTWLNKFIGLSDAEVSGYIAALVTVTGIAAWIGPAAWSWIEKKRTALAIARAIRKAEVAAAVASAELTAHATSEAGRPVLVPVTVNETPIGQLNEAVAIPRAEAAAAPSVPLGPPLPAPRT